MNNVDEAVSALAKAAGLAALKLDAKGNATLQVDQSTVHLMKMDDHHLELMSGVSVSPSEPTAEVLARLLEAHVLGRSTGAARLSMNTESGQIYLGERVDVRDLDVVSFGRRIGVFSKMAAYWNSDAARAIVRPGSKTN